MTSCVNIQRPKRDVCIGDMDNLIDIKTRDIGTSATNEFEFDDSFTFLLNIAALVETKKGITIFDNANIERVVTHWFYIRFMFDLDINTWVIFKGKTFDVIDLENLDERDEFILLQCAERGDETLAANRI